MPEKIRQHFVPRFYLKFFSVGGQGKTIGLYNVRSNVFVGHSTLKTQAYRKNFYGKHLLLENALADFEAETSVVLRGIVVSGQLPEYGSDDFGKVVAFALVQYGRTVGSLNTHAEMVEKTFQIANKNNPSKETSDALGPSSDGALVAHYLGLVLQNLPILMDLELKLLVNPTVVPFVTSDNPVVLYNQFLEGKDAIGGITGLAAKGLQIFLPISPKLTLYFYDAKVYGVGHKSRQTLNVATDDVNQLNMLQSLNCFENIFFSEDFDSSSIERIDRSVRRYRTRNMTHVEEYYCVTNKSEHRSLIVAHKIDIRCKLSLAGTRILRKGKKYQLDGKAVHIRNMELVDSHERQLGINRSSPIVPVMDLYISKSDRRRSK